MLHQQMLHALSKRVMPRRPFWFALFDRLGAWHQRAEERRRLGAFNDAMLKDIGLSRADIEDEISRPFWRD